MATDTSIEQLIRDLASEDSLLREQSARMLAGLGGRGHRAVLGALSDPSPASRLAAARALTQFAARAAVAPLVEALKDPERAVADAAAESLAHFGKAPVQAASALLWHRDRQTRLVAARALGLIGEPSLRALAKALADHAVPVRIAAAVGLGQSRCPGALPLLADAIRDRHPEVRVAAVQALADHGTPEAFELATTALADPEPRVAAEAAACVGRTGEAAIPALLAWIADASGGLSEAVADALAELGTAPIPALFDLAASDDPRRSEAALEVLRRMGSSAGAQEAAKRLGDAAQRRYAAEALLAWGQVSVPALVERLGVEDADLRSTVVSVAARIGEAVVPAAVGVLAEGGGSARLAAATLLGAVGGEMAQAALVDALADADPRVRSAAAVALGRTGARGTVEALVPLMGDPDPQVAAAALEALRALGRPGIQAALQSYGDSGGGRPETLRALLSGAEIGALEQTSALLSSRHWSVRAETAQVLAELSYEPASLLIASLLSDPEPQVAATAARSLAALGPDAATALRLFLRQCSPVQRDGAVRALVGATPESVQALLPMLEDPDEETREIGVEVVAAFGEAACAPLAALARSASGASAAARALELIEGSLAPAAPTPLPGDAPPQALETAREGPPAPAVVGEVANAVDAGLTGAPATAPRASAPSLAEALRSGDEQERAEAIQALQALPIAPAEALDPLLDLITQPPPVGTGARAFASTRHDLCLPGLIDRLGAEDPGLRHAAASLCAAIGAPSVEGLMLAAETGTAVARLSALSALGAIGGPRATAVFLTAALDTDPQIRAHAALGLGHGEGPEAFGVLCELSLDDNSDVRVAAARALAAMGTPQAIEALVDRLRPDDIPVFQAAVRSLDVADTDALQTFVGHFVRESGEVKRQLVNSLSAVGPAAEPVLKACLAHESPHLRSAAVFPLVALSGEQAVPAVLPLLADAEADVRQAAAAALSSLGRTSSSSAIDMLRNGDLPAALAAADVLAAAGGEWFEPLVAALKSEQAGPRAGACRALGALGDERAGPHLTARLKDPRPEVRSEAASALGRLAWAKGTPHLLGALDDPDPGVAQAAIGALRQLGQPAVDALLARLVDAEGTISAGVVQALADIGETALRSVLRTAQEGSLTARVAALRVVGTIGGERAVVPLVHAISDPEPRVRSEAAHGIAAIGRPAVAKLAQRLTHSPPPEVRDAIVDTLVTLGEGAVPETLDMLQGSAPELWETAATILGRIGTGAVPAIRSALGHADPEVQGYAIRAAAQTGDVSLVPQLTGMVEDQSPQVTAEAIRALALLGDPRGAAAVVRALGHPDGAVRDALRFALPRFGDSLAGALVERLVDDDPAVVEQAADALKLLGGRAEEALVLGLRSELPAMRMAAAHVLADMASHLAVPPLVRALADRDPAVRAKVAAALGAIGAPAVAPILDRMPGADAHLQDAIFTALQAMAVDPVYSLMERARDADETVRLAAVTMAGRLRRPEAVPTLQQRLHDTSLEINIAAVDALAAIATEEAIEALAEVATANRAELGLRAREVLRPHAGTAIPMLVRLAARGEGVLDASYVTAAAELARTLPEAVQPLLADSSEQVRRAAAAVLGSVGGDEALRSLVQKACSQDGAARRAAMEALADMGPGALALLAGLLEAPDPVGRHSAASVLGQMGDPGFEVLVRQLEGCEDPRQAATICAAVAAARPSGAAAALRGIVAAERRDAAWVAAAAALAAEADAEGRAALDRALASDDPELRVRVVRALSELGTVLPSSWLSLLDDADGRVREAVAAALETLQTSDTESLVRYTGHADSRVRRAAARALRECAPDESGSAALVRLLTDPAAEVAEVALESLAAIGGEALGALSAAARGGDADTRRAACGALAQFGAHATRALLALAEDAPPDTVAECLRALGKAGDPAARPMVLGRLRDDEPGVRAAAVGALRHLATEAEHAQLAACLADPHEGVRALAAITAAAVMTADLRSLVADLLTAPEPTTRAAAAQTLQIDNYPGSGPLLLKAARAEREAWVAALMYGAAESIARPEYPNGDAR
jgi:HEAT repeat protein